MPAKPTHVDVFVDVAFKRLFDPEKQKVRLLSFLNSMLPAEEQVAEVEPLPNEALGHNDDDRLTILDIAVKTERGRRFLIEIQLARQRHFLKRLLWYGARLISNERRGQTNWDYDFLPVIVIGIVDFEIEPGRKVCRYAVTDEATGARFPGDGLTVQLVQLPAFRREPHVHDSALEEWLYLTQNPADMSFEPQHIEPEVAFEFMKDTDFDRLSNAEQWKYLDRWRKANDDYWLRKDLSDAKAELATFKEGAAAEVAAKEAEVAAKEAELSQKDRALSNVAALFRDQGDTPAAISEKMALDIEEVRRLLA